MFVVMKHIFNLLFNALMLLLRYFLCHASRYNSCCGHWHYWFLNHGCWCRRKFLNISHLREILLDYRGCLWSDYMSGLPWLLYNISVHLMNNWFIDLMDNVAMNLMNHRLMNLANFFFIDDWLMMLMNDWLDMFMNDILVVFMNHLLMMFMDNISMRFLNYWSIHFLNDPWSISLNIYYCRLCVSWQNLCLRMFDNSWWHRCHLLLLGVHCLHVCRRKLRLLSYCCCCLIFMLHFDCDMSVWHALSGGHRIHFDLL